MYHPNFMPSIVGTNKARQTFCLTNSSQEWKCKSHFAHVLTVTRSLIVDWCTKFEICLGFKVRND